MDQPPLSTVKVCVRRMLSLLGNGACIFTGIDDGGKLVRMVAPPRALARAPADGEFWVVKGVFRENTRFGIQLHVVGGRYELPRGYLLTRYLSENPDFCGIGEAKAKRLWDTFGEQLHVVLSQRQPEMLTQVLSPLIARRLVDTWAEKQDETELVEFLDAHGIDWQMASAIRRVWGAKAMDALRDNPYQLLAFAPWGQVDAVGNKLGIAPDDARRLVGAVESCLYERLDSGHTITPSIALETSLARRLGRTLTKRAIGLALDEGAACGNSSAGFQAFGAWSLEQGIARRLRSMISGKHSSGAKGPAPSLPFDRADHVIQHVEAEQGFTLNGEQRAAVLLPFEHQFSLLTGGAGVGKTAVLRVVRRIAHEQHLHVFQMALAGRAAQRMEQATQHPAMTIAKFLNATRSGTLEVPDDSVVIVDEASMLDLSTLYRILQHLPNRARLVLVGDAAQLPPIGFGLAFHRLVNNPLVPQIHLRTVHRQAVASGIPLAAARVRNHVTPTFVPFKGKHSGVSFIDCSAEEVVPLLRRVSSDWAGEDWQVLAAVKAGRSGIRHINGSFHAQVTGDGIQESFMPGEPVIHLLNDYERFLMNGALGRIIDIEDDGGLRVNFDGETHRFTRREVAGRLELAYAVSVHKAQGSQFKRVAVVVSRGKLLDHSLVYTALTRGIEQVVFLGDREAFAEAVTSPPLAQRRDVAFTV